MNVPAGIRKKFASKIPKFFHSKAKQFLSKLLLPYLTNWRASPYFQPLKGDFLKILFDMHLTLVSGTWMKRWTIEYIKYLVA